jgi:hypothetical protein
MSGDPAVYVDCDDPLSNFSCSVPQTLPFELKGNLTGLTPKLYCDGGDHLWTDSVNLDAQGKGSFLACSDDFKCLVELKPGLWLTNVHGVLDGMSLFVKGVYLNKGHATQWAYDLDFNLSDGGTITPLGDLIPIDDGSQTGICTAPYNLFFELVGGPTTLVPWLFADGGSHLWGVTVGFNASRIATFASCPGPFKGNVELDDDIWLVGEGLPPNYHLYIWNEQTPKAEMLKGADANGDGYHDFTWTLNADGTITQTGDVLAGTSVEIIIGIEL